MSMIKNVGIIDYGCGNIYSLKCALEKIGCKVTFINHNKEDVKVDALFLPGVGAFDIAMKKIKSKNLDVLVKSESKKGKLIIGICLGMQLLVSEGVENSIQSGLNLINGDTYKLKFKNNEKNINIGWKNTEFIEENFLKEFNDEKFYYVHSYAVKTKDENIHSYSKFNNQKFISSITKNNIVGFQFHPEKSGELGLNLIEFVLKAHS